MKILFVCTGNTCRSPMAQVLCAQLAAQRGLDIVCDSSGVAADKNAPASRFAIEAVRELGCDLENHRAKPLTQALLKQADLVVCMSPGHAAVARQLAPQANVVLLGDGVPDPYGGSLADYRQTAKAIIAALEELLSASCE